jgi:hypothetical protein
VDTANSKNTSAGTWRFAAICFGILTTVASVWGLMQFARAQSLSDRLERALQNSASLQTSLADANMRLNDAESRLRANEARLTEVAKPDLPVMVSFRPALLGSGLVAVFKNTNSTQLEVAATFSSAATGIRRGANLVIPGNGMQEIGYAQGWTFAAGQHIRLTNGEYRPAEYQVPGR